MYSIELQIVFYEYQNKNHKIKTQFCQPRGAEGFNLKIFHFHICGKLSIILSHPLSFFFLSLFFSLFLTFNYLSLSINISYFCLFFMLNDSFVNWWMAVFSLIIVLLFLYWYCSSLKKLVPNFNIFYECSDTLILREILEKTLYEIVQGLVSLKVVHEIKVKSQQMYNFSCLILLCFILLMLILETSNKGLLW